MRAGFNRISLILCFSSGDTPLRMFLQASMLSSEGDSESEEDNKDVRDAILSVPSELICNRK